MSNCIFCHSNFGHRINKGLCNHCHKRGIICWDFLVMDFDYEWRQALLFDKLTCKILANVLVSIVKQYLVTTQSPFFASLNIVASDAIMPKDIDKKGNLNEFALRTQCFEDFRSSVHIPPDVRSLLTRKTYSWAINYTRHRIVLCHKMYPKERAMMTLACVDWQRTATQNKSKKQDVCQYVERSGEKSILFHGILPT